MANDDRFCICGNKLSETRGTNKKRVCTGCHLVYEGEYAGFSVKPGAIKRNPIVSAPKIE
jgi:hypothetical protein